jgi:hypothetical protein
MRDGNPQGRPCVTLREPHRGCYVRVAHVQVALAVFALLLTACTATTAPAPARHAAPGAAPAACPRSVSADDGVRNAGDGLAQRLVPGTPTAARICRYSPLGGVQGPTVAHGVLYGDKSLGSTDAARLAAALNAIPADHSAEHTCPPDFNRVDLLVFQLPGRDDVEIRSSSSGCWSFTNGNHRTGSASAMLDRYQALLQSLAPRQSEVYAGAGGARGTVQGRLLAEYGVERSHPVIGKVYISAPSAEPVLVGSDGIFAITVAPGTYTLTGRSPTYSDARGICRALRPVTIVAGRTTYADVNCIGK